MQLSQNTITTELNTTTMSPKSNRKNKIGIAGLQSPIELGQQDGKIQHSIANCTATASIAHMAKADISQEVQNMLGEFTTLMTPLNWQELLGTLKSQLGAEEVSISISCPFFMVKQAPVSKLPGLMEYNCTFTGSTETGGIAATVYVPVTTLCPCSKEISDGGAHNQRAEATFTVLMTERIWLEELIKLVEKSASCELYSVLKRPDEKYVTEKAFNNPMFVEDVVRKIACEALAHPRIEKFSIGVESFESIHKHSAYAFVDSDDLVK